MMTNKRTKIGYTRPDDFKSMRIEPIGPHNDEQCKTISSMILITDWYQDFKGTKQNLGSIGWSS